MKIFDAHAAAKAFPPLKGDEMERLKKSILDHGQLFPAVLLDGQILDGRNRQEALRQLVAEKKLKPDTELKVVPFRGGSIAGFADAANDKRRHLTESQRAMIATKLLPLFRKEAKERQAAAARLTNRKKKGEESKGATLRGKGRRAAELAADAAGYKVSPRTIERAEFVQKTDPALARQVFEGELTVKQAEKTIRRRAQDEVVKTYVPPEGKYQLVTVDFAWKYNDALDGSDAVRGGCPYPPMTLNEILAFVRGPLARCCDAVCLLGCWVTNPILLDLLTWAPVQLEIQKLGFRAVKLNTWRKVEESGKPFTGLGNGQRNDTEQLVLFARGTVLYNEMGEAHGNPVQRTCFDAPIGEHSEKPQLAYDRLKALVPYTTRLEMFARAPREGWVTSGAELAHPPMRGDAAPARPALPNDEVPSPSASPSFSQEGGPSAESERSDEAKAEFIRSRTRAQPVDLSKVFEQPQPPGPTLAYEYLSTAVAPITTQAERREALAEVHRLTALSPKPGTPDAGKLDALHRALDNYRSQKRLQIVDVPKPGGEVLAEPELPPVDPASVAAVPGDEIPF